MSLTGLPLCHKGMVTKHQIVRGVAVLRDKLGYQTQIQVHLPFVLILLIAALFISLAAFISRLGFWSPVLLQIVFVICWLLLIIRGFFGHREAYRVRFGPLAYKRAFFRFFLFAAPLLITILVHPLLLPPGNLIPSPLSVALAGFFLSLGFLIWFRALRHFGLDRAALVYTYFPEEGELIQNKTYGFLRHPLYADWLLTSSGFALWTNSIQALLLVGIIGVMVLIWVRCEERELIERFGRSYQEYRNRTPALFPRPGNILSFLLYLLSGRLLKQEEEQSRGFPP